MSSLFKGTASCHLAIAMAVSETSSVDFGQSKLRNLPVQPGTQWYATIGRSSIALPCRIDPRHGPFWMRGQPDIILGGYRTHRRFEFERNQKWPLATR
ncbi:hypothetical protein LX32DRAFT_8416 [Colletotrichum zoysiae]|uniref:Uncharacterized protein n=1 Tax=Colletotrichum zoysiae TaxID=1216348 RepID=A0AAD9M6V6_9PEZI|nr:hypothetical protein LX32DRAFT_8416 [Colletotrichum zoysiae]